VDCFRAMPRRQTRDGEGCDYRAIGGELAKPHMDP